MEEFKTCPNDCTKCTPMQRQLCAAQFSMMSVRRMDAIEERLERMEEQLQKQAHEESGVFSPMTVEAQRGSGAENRLPESLTIEN